jgi:site-specific DNA-cytosine methylase
VTAIELFGCAGGMAEGFRRAGVTFDMVFDKDPDACASYEANHGHRPNVRDLLRMVAAGWRPTKSLDLLVADPPCTPWAAAILRNPPWVFRGKTKPMVWWSTMPPGPKPSRSRAIVANSAARRSGMNNCHCCRVSGTTM